MEKRCLGAGTLRNLADAGCDPDTVRSYCEMEQCVCEKPGVRQQQIELLCKHRKHRRELLDELHGCQDKIDCLDYLLYQLKEKEHE